VGQVTLYFPPAKGKESCWTNRSLLWKQRCEALPCWWNIAIRLIWKYLLPDSHCSVHNCHRQPIILPKYKV